MVSSSSSLFLMGICKAFLLVALLSSAAKSISSSAAFEFDVGDENGWVVPPSENTQIYNQWASKNRFKIGDVVAFRYKKDSVMEVTEADYGHCNASHPIFFSNSGHTEFRLGHSGTFYFISGAAGHCEMGQKMIIKVLSELPPSPGDSPPSDHPGDAPPAGTDTGDDKSGAVVVRSSSMASTTLVFLVVLLMGSSNSSSSFFFF